MSVDHARKENALFTLDRDTVYLLVGPHRTCSSHLPDFPGAQSPHPFPCFSLLGLGCYYQGSTSDYPPSSLPFALHTTSQLVTSDKFHVLHFHSSTTCLRVRMERNNQQEAPCWTGSRGRRLGVATLAAFAQHCQGNPASDPVLPCTQLQLSNQVHTQSSWEEATCLPSSLHS